MNVDINELEQHILSNILLAVIDNTLEDKKVAPIANSLTEFQAVLDLLCKVKGVSVRCAKN